MRFRRHVLWTYGVTRFGCLKMIQLALSALVFYLSSKSVMTTEKTETTHSYMIVVIVLNTVMTVIILYNVIMNMVFKMKECVYKDWQNVLGLFNLVFLLVEVILLSAFKDYSYKSQVFVAIGVQILIILVGMLDIIYYRKFFEILGPIKVRFNFKSNETKFFDNEDEPDGRISRNPARNPARISPLTDPQPSTSSASKGDVEMSPMKSPDKSPSKKSEVTIIHETSFIESGESDTCQDEPSASPPPLGKLSRRSIFVPESPPRSKPK